MYKHKLIDFVIQFMEEIDSEVPPSRPPARPPACLPACLTACLSALPVCLPCLSWDAEALVGAGTLKKTTAARMDALYLSTMLIS